jgi:hypothetical protein
VKQGEKIERESVLERKKSERDNFREKVWEREIER